MTLGKPTTQPSSANSFTSPIPMPPSRASSRIMKPPAAPPSRWDHSGPSGKMATSSSSSGRKNSSTLFGISMYFRSATVTMTARLTKTNPVMPWPDKPNCRYTHRNNSPVAISPSIYSGDTFAPQCRHLPRDNT
ncbi:hypothetical protein D3C75_1028690 [compost metagenome]